MGRRKYPEYVIKGEGYTVVQTVTGETTPGRGGFMYKHPNPTTTNRSRLFSAFGDKIFMFDITNNTLVMVRDVATLDSATISFMSGVQAKTSLYMAVGDSTLTSSLFKYDDTSTGSITAFADAGGGEVTVTSATHGMETGNTVVITGTTSYNGTFVITKVDANDYKITTAFVADDATGTWTGDTVTKETMTALVAARLLGKLDDRIMSAGTGDSNDKVQYSKLKTDGNFTDFTSSTATDGGGVLSGSLGAVTALGELKGFALVSESNQITVHTIGTQDVSGTGRIKDTVTINEEVTLSGIGTDSPKGLAVINDNAYIVTRRKGIYKYDPLGRSTAQRLTDLTAKFRPLFAEFDLSSSSVIEDQKNNRLLVTASSEEDIGADTIFTNTFDTKSWAFDDGKSVNQVFWDSVNQKTFGLSSIVSEIHELYDGQFQNDTDDISMSAETRLFSADDRHRNKRYISTSILLGASDENQEFLIEYFVDDDDEPAFSETVAVADFINITGTAEQGSGESIWAGGVPGASGQLGYLHYFHNGFIPDFDRISVRVTETSPFKSALHQPKIKYSLKDDELDSFNP